MRQVAAPADDPQFAALHARCRAAGVDLMRGSTWQGEPCFLACRYGLAKELPTLLAVENWLAWTTGEAARQARMERGQPRSAR